MNNIFFFELLLVFFYLFLNVHAWEIEKPIQRHGALIHSLCGVETRICRAEIQNIDERLTLRKQVTKQWLLSTHHLLEFVTGWLAADNHPVLNRGV